MGSRIMHSIIGFKIAEELKVEDVQSFLLGSIAADAVFSTEEKNASHYFVGEHADHSRSVDADGFLSEHHSLVNDRNEYILGYYTHLLADNIWLGGFYLSWLKNRMQADDELYQLYHQDFRLLNGKLLEHYGLADNLRNLFSNLPSVPDLKSVKSGDVGKFVPYVLGDMEYDKAAVEKDLQVFTMIQIIGYIETSIELGLYKLRNLHPLRVILVKGGKPDLQKLIDAHIHLDLYENIARKNILDSLEQNQIEGLITVSNNLISAKKNLELANNYTKVQPAFGFHPEQVLPNEKEVEKLLEFMTAHQKEMVAIGEVGLPYYLRKGEKGIRLEAYIELLEQFVIFAKETNKPIILHAIYEDAPVVCSLLERYSVSKAHFHWFKGDTKTLKRIQENGYYLSVTPDIVYEREIQLIAKDYRLSQLMVETDGPWPFKGPFKGQMTHPKMIHDSMKVIARLKRMDLKEVYSQICQNTKEFFIVN